MTPPPPSDRQSSVQAEFDTGRSDADSEGSVSTSRKRQPVDANGWTLPPADEERCVVVRDYDSRRCPRRVSDGADDQVCALHDHTVTYETVEDVRADPEREVRPDATE